MNTESTRAIGKGMKSERIKEALLATKSYFHAHGRKLYRGHVGLIAGLPFETEQTFRETIEWLVGNWQGQSWGVHHLGIPAESSVAKQSEISKNIMKYGYSQMTPEQIRDADSQPLQQTRTIQRKGSHKDFDSEIYWQNAHMNIFDAQRLVREAYIVKQKHDFRPGCFMINYRLKNKSPLEERLGFTFAEYDQLIDENISQYISKKIN